MITHTLASAAEIWQAVDSVTPENPPIADALYKLLRWLLWFVLVGGLAAITYGGGLFAWEKHQGIGGESTSMIVKSLIGGIIAVSGAGIMNAALPS